MPSHLPTGGVTFLFTDIEGSTNLVDRVGEEYAELLATHHRVVREAIATNDGIDLRTEGDSFFAVFTSPSDAVATAIAAQQAIAASSDLAAENVKVRMGVHAGEGQLGGDNYVGIDVHLAARIQSAAHGGQILVSDTVIADLPNDAAATDLGLYWLKDIAEPTRLLQVTADGLDREFEPINAAPTHPQNAPRDLSSFIGRGEEVEKALELVGECRLVTLTGPGGTGKTRLSIEIGAHASRSFPDGVYFVPLAGIDDVESVPNSIIDAAGVRNTNASVPPIEAVTHHLGDKKTLLILDNMEHVLAAAPHIQNVLDKAANTSVLATSRTPLRVRGERELAVQPLDITTSAMNLFADRASAVNASFELTEENRSDVEEIVRRVDGLPLAVELAAARTRMMSPASILSTLDPLSLATTGADASGHRGVSLNDTIQWSFDLLTEPEQQLLIRLAVFPTGAGLEQINAVCQPGPDLGLDLINGVGALVEHSLLIGDETAGTPRFRMLETIREFAVRLLSQSLDEQPIRQRHLEAYTQLLEETRPKLDTAETAIWMAYLGTENANLQAAFAYAIETGNAEYAQRIVCAAWRFWQSRGHLAEGTIAATQALALEGAPPLITATALDAAGSIAYWVGDAPATRSYYEEAVAIRRNHDVTDGLANALYNLSFPVSDEDGRDAASELVEEAIALAEAEGDERMLVLGNVSLARAWLTDNPERAIGYADTAIEYTERVNDPSTRAWVLAMQSVAILHATGEAAIAVTRLQESLETFHGLTDSSGIAVVLASIAHIARLTGHDEMALYSVGVVSNLREETGIGVNTAMDETIKMFDTPESIAALAPNLQARYHEGRTDDLDTTVANVLAWTGPDD